DSVVVPELGALGAGDRVVIGDGFYDALVGLGPVDGVPCVSFTSPEPPEERTPAAPSEAYLRTIVTGLAECHPLGPEAIADRVATARGVRPTWDVDEIAALMHVV
ncbi:MAG: histone deacetylase, partial [Actinomycetota bacterium]